MEIVIDWVVVSLVAMGLAWAVNSGIPLLGKLFRQDWALSAVAKKAIAFAASVGLVFFWLPPLELPDPSVDLFAFVEVLLAQAVFVFKTAQQIYDRLWQGLVAGAKRLLSGG